MEARLQVLHMGLQTTLIKVRQKWWITKGRATIKKYLHRCLVCKIYQGKPYTPPPMPPLPTFEGKMCKPFEVTGLDYFGPLSVKCEDNENLTIKRWVFLLV